ncbi:MAG: chemotaxis protein CheW [Myxococcales bacterium]
MPGELLVQVRCGFWRVLVPLRQVERVLPAALPGALPSSAPGALPVVNLAGEPLPLILGEVLLGAERVSLRQSDQMLCLTDGTRRALLWVSAAEDLIPWEPAPAPATGEFLAGFHRSAGVAVLDIFQLLDAVSAAPRPMPEVARDGIDPVGR